MAGIRVLLTCAVLALCGCTSGDAQPGGAATGTAAAPTATATGATPAPTATTAPTSRPGASPTATPRPPRFDSDAAVATVQRLAGDIGPREATSRAFREAVDLVAARFERHGFRVERVAVPVPAGESWGVPVRAGTSWNVVATPPGFRADRPHRVVGAHLDTVPQAPGAEDNASGVAVLLELARMAAAAPPEVPAVLVAFGAEEPRGPGDERHHYGSRQMVADLSVRERDAVVGMLALDRVGVRDDRVPACFGGRHTDDVREQLVAAARRVDVAVRRCENRTSDHWSFEKAAIPAGRLGSVPYPAYHSSRDLPGVVDEGQLDRVGRIAWEWLQAPAP